MLDVLVQQFVLDLVFQLFDELHAHVAFYDQVCGEGVLRGADGPDVDMMKVFYTAHFGDGILYFFYFDPARDPVQREPEAVTQQLPGAEEDDDGDKEAQGGVDPKQVGVKDDKTTDDKRSRHDGIREEVEEGAADIEIAFLTAEKKHGGERIDGDADGCHDGDRLAREGLRIHEAVYGFIADGSDGQQQDGCVQQGYEDGRLFIAVGLFFGGFYF